MIKYKNNYYYSIRIVGYVRGKNPKESVIWEGYSNKLYSYTVYFKNNGYTQAVRDFEEFLSWEDAVVQSKKYIDTIIKNHKDSFIDRNIYDWNRY